MICGNCKKQINNDEKFCGYCGATTAEKIPDDRIQYSALNETHNRKTNFDFSDHDNSSSSSGNGDIAVGVIVLIIGAALTWITYESASEGGTYFVFWGLMIYGGYKILKGIAS